MLTVTASPPRPPGQVRGHGGPYAPAGQMRLSGGVLMRDQVLQDMDELGCSPALRRLVENLPDAQPLVVRPHGQRGCPSRRPSRWTPRCT